MGMMKMKLIGDVEYSKPNLMQIKIKHPNITGLQPMRIGSHVHPPAHFINTVNVNLQRRSGNEGDIDLCAQHGSQPAFLLRAGKRGDTDGTGNGYQERGLVFRFCGELNNLRD